MFDERMSLVQLRIPESADSYKLANLGKFFRHAAVLPSLDTHVPTYQKRNSGVELRATLANRGSRGEVPKREYEGSQGVGFDEKATPGINKIKVYSDRIRSVTRYGKECIGQLAGETTAVGNRTEAA